MPSPSPSLTPFRTCIEVIILGNHSPLKVGLTLGFELSCEYSLSIQLRENGMSRGEWGFWSGQVLSFAHTSISTASLTFPSSWGSEVYLYVQSVPTKGELV